jgi:geranyl-CoA carboxylase beta subunit
VQAATGEVATDEELGGAEMHATLTGTAEYLAEDDVDAIRIARDVMSRLAHVFRGSAPVASAPLGDDLLSVVPVDPKRPYDAREIIRRLSDDERFSEVKALYGAATVCAHASIEGQPVGFIANNGPIDPQGATKAAQFIQLACQSGTPLVYLQNTTGYLIGRDAESAGMVKHGSKMIQAVANASVPQLTLVIGGSYGAGNYGMCGRAFAPRFIFAWPNSRTAVMGGEQAARVMSIVTEQKLARKGEKLSPAARAAMEKEIVERVEAESTALYATARLWDDGIIDPRDSRRVLGLCLRLCRDGAARQLRPNSFGVARL